MTMISIDGIISISDIQDLKEKHLLMLNGLMNQLVLSSIKLIIIYPTISISELLEILGTVNIVVESLILLSMVVKMLIENKSMTYLKMIHLFMFLVKNSMIKIKFLLMILENKKLMIVILMIKILFMKMMYLMRICLMMLMNMVSVYGSDNSNIFHQYYPQEEVKLHISLLL